MLMSFSKRLMQAPPPRRRGPAWLRREFGQHFAQPLGLGTLALFCQALAGMFEDVGETLLLDGLDEIADRLGIEGAHGMFGISGHEDEQRRLDLHDALNHGKSVKTGHLDIQEDEIGLVGLDGADGFAAVAARLDDFDVLVSLQSAIAGPGSRDSRHRREWF